MIFDFNKDGNPFDATDTDGDQKPNFLDNDDDGDTILTKDEFSDLNLDGNPADAQNLDNDQWPNYLDADDDGDTLLTIQELSIYKTDPYLIDSDDVADNIELDDQTNPLDQCSLIVAHQTEYSMNWNTLDCDGDGLLNGDEQGIDTDFDGIPNYYDNDDDNDGLTTDLENPDRNGDGYSEDAFDSDTDGIPDYLDANSYTPSITVAEDIEIYNAMSPNGDGLNDVFTIRNIEAYPDNELTIFNRWGKILYQTKSYGQYNRFFYGKSNTGETLPVGTYYYSLTIYVKGALKEFKGFLYINQ